MDYRDFEDESLVNRNSPIPVIAISDDDFLPEANKAPSPLPSQGSPGKTSKREGLKQSKAAQKLREKLEDLEARRADSPSSSKDKIQDRVFNMLLQQVIPSEELPQQDAPVDRRSRKYVDRPGFSLPLMSSNFRRFNARIGVAFVFQNRMIRLLTWRVPTHTLSFLAVYSFLCLDPYLLAIAPLATCLFFIMVPAFLTRHPPPPSTSPTDMYEYGLYSPAIAPPRHIKPAPEMSKDFFRNMRDLQNSMEDFSRLHDAVIAWLAPPTNFSNEALSSSLFLIITFLASSLFIVAHLIPWRAVFLIGGWVTVCAGHPALQDFFRSTNAESVVEEHETMARSWLIEFAKDDIVLATAPEKKEVEIFELQHRNMYGMHAEWERFMFSPAPYTPLSPARIAGDRPRGTPFFEDVQPPPGWRWADKKWTLDLFSREWVHDRCITGVEVEIEGERWVTDIRYDDHNPPDEVEVKKNKRHSRAKSKEKLLPSWEEGNGTRQLGEWRRRRWIRLVERKVIEPKK